MDRDLNNAVAAWFEIHGISLRRGCRCCCCFFFFHCYRVRSSHVLNHILWPQRNTSIYYSTLQCSRKQTLILGKNGSFKGILHYLIQLQFSPVPKISNLTSLYLSASYHQQLLCSSLQWVLNKTELLHSDCVFPIIRAKKKEGKKYKAIVIMTFMSYISHSFRRIMN